MWQMHVAHFLSWAMLECPHDLAWSHWPPRTRPRQFILLVAIILLVASLLYAWLPGTWEANLLLVAFVFSLRNFLFVQSVLLAEDGVSLSHPLTGARRWTWSEVGGLELTDTHFVVSLLNKKCVEFPSPPGPQRVELQAWIQWQQHPDPSNP